MPEETKTVMSADEQMEALHRELAGHPVFRRLRGTLWQTTGDLLAKRRQSLSPTQAREDARQFGADLSWMQGLLAKLARDGHTVAESELESALAYPGHRMLGEIVPVEKTVPITLVAIRPDALLPLMSWLQVFVRREEDFRLAGTKDKDAHPGLSAFFDAFPEQAVLRRETSVLDHGQFGSLLDWYRTQVCGPEIHFIHGGLSSHEGKDEWNYFQCHMYSYLRGRRDGCDCHDPMLMWVFRQSQKQVLSAIGRREQSNFATWQIDLPAIYDGGNDGIEIGIHPESEHELWRKRYPSLVSHGVQCGYGAIAMPHELVGYRHDRKTTPNGSYVRFCLHGGRKF